jgi:hypothetical protein
MGQKFTITEEERENIRNLYNGSITLLNEQKISIVSELIGKTVTFEFMCYKTSYGDIQVKINNATYNKIVDDDDTFYTIILDVELLGDQSTKFQIMVLNKEGTINWNFSMMGPYGKKIKFCDSGLKTLINDKFYNHIKTLQKYPIVRVKNKKPSTDFLP